MFIGTIKNLTKLTSRLMRYAFISPFSSTPGVGGSISTYLPSPGIFADCFVHVL